MYTYINTKKIYLLFLFFLIILNINTSVFAGEKNNSASATVLLVGLELSDINFHDRKTLSLYKNIITRQYTNNKTVKELSDESGAGLIIVRHMSGTYAYSPEGKIIQQVELADKTQERLMSDSNAYTIYKNNYNKNNRDQPLPGENIPRNLFIGESRYSYLFGEGKNIPPSEPNAFRKSVSEFAGIAQNNSYPFWYETDLRTNTNLNAIYGNINKNGEYEFPKMSFKSNATSDTKTVVTQWASSGLGVGATVLDAWLDKKELNQQKKLE